MSPRTCHSWECWARVRVLRAKINDMEKMRLKCDVKKVFVDGNDVCLFYDLKMSEKTIFVCAWYEVQGGKK